MVAGFHHLCSFAAVVSTGWADKVVSDSNITARTIWVIFIGSSQHSVHSINRNHRSYNQFLGVVGILIRLAVNLTVRYYFAPQMSRSSVCKSGGGTQNSCTDSTVSRSSRRPTQMRKQWDDFTSLSIHTYQNTLTHIRCSFSELYPACRQSADVHTSSGE